MVSFVFVFCLIVSFQTSGAAFICDSGGTISSYARCDGDEDCWDGSDEKNCDKGSDEDYKCEFSEAFYCNDAECIPLEDQCNGRKDCDNGRDEEQCDFGSLTAQYLNVSKIKALKWMRSQHNADWGWNENTHRGVVALYLAGGANFNESNKEDELIAKQLELEVATFLLRRQYEKVSLSDLAAYINALQVICHDPRNFFGYDLISILREDLETNSSFIAPFPYLTLCNAEESISDDAVIRLLKLLNTDSLTHGFLIEVQALATMVLSCYIKNENASHYVTQNVTESLNNLKSLQMEDGSFGNVYTTALVLQALIANTEGAPQNWNIKSSIDFLASAQKPDGSFGNFLTTYLVLPLLNAKSLLDIGNINCTLKRPRDVNSLLNVKSRFGKKIIVKYSLFVGDNKDLKHSLMFRAPENITVFELMTLAAQINTKYNFKIHWIKKKMYVYEISDVPNDPEHNKFWFIYKGLKNDTIEFSEQSPNKIAVHEHDDIIMWYKTLDALN